MGGLRTRPRRARVFGALSGLGHVPVREQIVHCLILTGEREPFAQLSANCFSSCSCLGLLGRIFKHQFSELMFDGDCRRKFDFSSEPVCAHWALLWPSTPTRRVTSVRL